MKASNVPDHEPLMVVAANQDYGYQLFSADKWHWPTPPAAPPTLGAALYAAGNLFDVKQASWTWDDYHGLWVRYETYEWGPDNIGMGRLHLEQELWWWPEKVLLAKLRKLVRRGLLDGCPCGCRGDFTITEAGRQLLASSGIALAEPTAPESRHA